MIDLDLTVILPLTVALLAGGGVLLRGLMSAETLRRREESERRAYIREMTTGTTDAYRTELDSATLREVGRAEARADAAIAARLGADPAGDAAAMVGAGRGYQVR